MYMHPIPRSYLVQKCVPSTQTNPSRYIPKAVFSRS